MNIEPSIPKGNIKLEFATRIKVRNNVKIAGIILIHKY
jgi:hypothetical protein